MALTTEFQDIPEGEAWVEIENTTTNFSIQNTTGVLMEYTFTDGIKLGSYLTPYTVIHGIEQSMYVRFNNTEQKGTISITRES